MEQIKPAFTEENQFEHRDEKTLKALLGTSDSQDSDARTKINDFSREYFSSSFKLPIKIFMQKLKLLVMRKFEFKYTDKPMNGTIWSLTSIEIPVQ